MKYWLFLLLWASFGFLLVGVIKLSVIKGDYYKSLARENRIMEVVIPASRGEIVDKKGRVLAKSVYNYYEEWENGEKKLLSSGPYDGTKLENREISFEIKRQYPYKEVFGLVTGYVGKVTEDEMKNNSCQIQFFANEIVGRMGLEKQMDCILRGSNGRRLIEVDARGKYVRELGREEPIKGDNVELSIDGYWQDKAYEFLKGQKATMVVSEVGTGKILVLASSPAIDPNVFSFNQDNNTIKEYLNDGDGLPMMNRAISGKYHPGSVFKIAMATAGLESGAVDKNWLVEDTGVIKIGEYSYNNWLWTKRRGTDGMVDMVTALKRSNDIYFYKLGETLGLNRIVEWSIKYGYGSKTGIELPGEVEGLVPDEEWKIKTKNEKWYLGNTYHLSIGQGDLSVTPLQVNMMTNAVASDGMKCQPSILKNASPKCSKLGIKQTTVDTIKEGMVAACKSGGTAWPLFNFKTSIACKTGTAEVGDGSKDTHAWLTAMVPANDPEIVITVMVERGGEGSDVAAPIVGDFLKDWLGEENTIVPRYTPTPGN